MTSGQTDHALPTAGAVEQMAWIPGGTFMMGSDHHYPEEAPAHQVRVEGFWIDRHPVTNAEFARFVHKTGHVTVAERPADPADSRRPAGVAGTGLDRVPPAASPG